MSVTFRPNGIKALAEENADANELPAMIPNRNACKPGLTRILSAVFILLH